MNAHLPAPDTLTVAGEGPCLATYWVRRYWQLLVVRILTGISVGGTFPLVFSLVGDLFFPHQACGRGCRHPAGHWGRVRCRAVPCRLCR